MPSSGQSCNSTAGAAALDLRVLSSKPVGDEWRRCRLLPHASRVCRGRVVTAALLHHRNDAAEDGDPGDDAQRLVVGAYRFVATWGWAASGHCQGNHKNGSGKWLDTHAEPPRKHGSDISEVNCAV